MAGGWGRALSICGRKSKLECRLRFSAQERALCAKPQAAESSAAPAAYRVAVDAHAAAAAGLEHGGHAFAASLDHVAAHLVAARAGDADAVLGQVALAHAHGEIAGADGHPVHHHAA